MYIDVLFIQFGFAKFFADKLVSVVPSFSISLSQIDIVEHFVEFKSM